MRVHIFTSADTTRDDTCEPIYFAEVYPAPVATEDTELLFATSYYFNERDARLAASDWAHARRHAVVNTRSRPFLTPADAGHPDNVIL